MMMIHKKVITKSIKVKITKNLTYNMKKKNIENLK